MSQKDTPESIVKSFVEGSITLKKAQERVGKSRATIYRYAKLLQEGKPLEDRRKYGNHRKYGKKPS